jgi:hypothetical protein
MCNALVSAVSGFFSVLAVTPVKSEHVLAAFPRRVLELNTDAGILKPLERSHRFLVTEAIPELEPVERFTGAFDLWQKAWRGRRQMTAPFSSKHESRARGRGSMLRQRRKH